MPRKPAEQAGKPIRKPKNATELHKTDAVTATKADVRATELRLTPAAARLAREAQLNAIGIDSLLAHFSEPGRGFRDMAEFANISTAQLWAWIKDDPKRREEYETAVEAKAHSYVDAAHDLADRVVEGELDPRRADVKIKLSQWSAARTQAYQEKRSVEHTIVHKLDLDDLKARLSQLVDVASTRTIEGEVVHSG